MKRFDIAEYRRQIAETKFFLQNQIQEKPQVGIILGTGLGKLVNEISVIREIDYETIPNFSLSTVESHAGKLILGELSGKKILAMQGRFHYYEGYSMQQITLPVRVMHELGIKKLIISNACGGMNPQFQAGDVMVIEDHINLLGDNPLTGPNLDEYGPRFPDMSEPYSKKLIRLAERTALENKISLRKGVYVAVTGPNLETRAEYRFLRALGADVVGMSTVPETIAAVHSGMEVLAFSVVTDECFPDTLKAVSVEDILATAAKAEPRLTLLMKAVVSKL